MKILMTFLWVFGKFWKISYKNLKFFDKITKNFEKIEQKFFSKNFDQGQGKKRKIDENFLDYVNFLKNGFLQISREP